MMADENPKLLALLNKIAAEQNYSQYDLKVTAVSTGGANFSSKLYLATISADKRDDLRLFAKVAALPQKMRDQIVLEVYESERYFYTKLVEVFKKLEEKRGLSQENKLALPKYYGAEATLMHEILVLEDLACKGFVLHNRREAVSWQYAASAITELAKFHALSMAYKHEHPSEFDETVQRFPRGIYTEHEGNKVFFDSGMKSALLGVREENKEKLRAFIDTISLAKFCTMYGALRRPMLIHTDFRPSNMLHRIRKDGTVELMVVDYQTLQLGCPMVDLLFFIFTATDGKFRAAHYQQLVEHYYSELGAQLSKFGLDIKDQYPREDFEFELRTKLPFGLMIAVFFYPTLLMAEDIVPPMDEELNMAALVVPVAGDLYIERLNEVVDDFVKWNVLV